MRAPLLPCIYSVLGTDCVCPTCGIPARVGNLVKNPSYDILVACVTKLRNIRLAQDSSEEQATRERSSQDRRRDLEQGTFIGSPIWTYDCGPTFPISDHFSSLSNVEAQTFPSLDTAMTMHRREREIQEKSELKQEENQEQAVPPSEAEGRGQGSSSEDGPTEVFPSQQTEILGDENHQSAQQQQPPPPTISQLQRLLSIRKGNSPTMQPLQESEMPQDRTPSYGGYQEPFNGVMSTFNTPCMPTPSFRRQQLDLESQYVSDNDQVQDQQTSNGPSRKRRMQADEYTSRAGTPSNGNGTTSRNKKALRIPKHDLYSPDNMIVMREPQQDIRDPPTSRRRKERAESGKVAPGIDAKRPWACTSCLKVMSIGRNVHIHECPACGQNQPDAAGNGGSSTTATDEDNDNVEDSDEYGQIIASSQPTLDSERFTLLSHRDVPLLPVNRAPNRSKLPQPQSSSHWTNSDPPGSEISTSSPAMPSSTSEPATAISCVFTGLNKEQKDAFDDNITRVIEAGLFMEHMPDQVFHESATHIITSVDPLVWKRLGVALCPRVLKYLVGMLSNGWVVRHEWFLDSIKSKIWLPLPDERYLIQGDAQFGPAPGTQHRRELRQQHSLKLFDSCRMFFYGEFGTAAQKSIKKQELLRLVQCGGASVLMKRPPKASSSSSFRARSRIPSGESSGPNNTNNSCPTVNEDIFFSPTRSFLYLTEDTKPWQVPIDKSVPIIVCDPNKIPSGHFTTTSSSSVESSAALTTSPATTVLSPADLKKHGWLRDFQAVSLTWILNCISCSLMGKADVDLLYGSSSPQEIRELDQAWDSWRAKKS
ncbi:BRCA1-associated RING domain protein 1 [Haplosporangium gracile]|nr:BRCA1-associated RING domain protein 1 [Haplosporangium gracile]